MDFEVFKESCHSVRLSLYLLLVDQDISSQLSPVAMLVNVNLRRGFSYRHLETGLRFCA